MFIWRQGRAIRNQPFIHTVYTIIFHKGFFFKTLQALVTGVMRNVPNTNDAWNWVGILDGYQDHVGQTTESEEDFSEMYHASALPEDQYNGKTVMYC